MILSYVSAASLSNKPSWGLMLCWSTGGEWEEPWDQQSALDTIRKLERRWYQLDRNNTAPDQSVEAAEQHLGASSDEEGPPRKRLKPSVNKVCQHAACSAQPVCLVEQLQTVRSNYRGRVDQFRIKVERRKQYLCMYNHWFCAKWSSVSLDLMPDSHSYISTLIKCAYPILHSIPVVHSYLAWLLLLLQAVERAIRELTNLCKPLVTEAEVAALTMGARSKDKVLEIIQTGTLRRNEMMADDEEQQIKQMVLYMYCVHDRPMQSCHLHVAL